MRVRRRRKGDALLGDEELAVDETVAGEAVKGRVDPDAHALWLVVAGEGRDALEGGRRLGGDGDELVAREGGGGCGEERDGHFELVVLVSVELDLGSRRWDELARGELRCSFVSSLNLALALAPTAPRLRAHACSGVLL